jgi:hypothetical protein
VKLYQAPELDGLATWGQMADNHGGGFVYPGRAVLVLPDRTWESTPEDCPRGAALEEGNHAYIWVMPCEWVLDGRVLVCPVCGVDCT